MTATVSHVGATANTGATTQDVTVTSFGTVVACLVLATNGVTDGTETSDATMCLGFAIPGSSYRAICVVSEDAKGTRSDTKVVRTADHALIIIDDANAILAKATLTAITNGVRVNWFNAAGTATAPPTAWKLEFLFIGGTDAQAAIVDVDGPPATGAGTTVISSLGFAPDGLFFLGPGTFVSSPSVNEGASIMLGFARRLPTILNACQSWADLDNVLTTAATSRVSDSVAVNAADDATGTTCSVTAFSSNGFTLTNNDLIVTGPATTCLAFKLPTPMWCGAITTPTSTGNTTHTDPGFRPQAAIIGGGRCGAVDSPETDDDASSWGLGMVGDSHGSESWGAATIRSNDAVNLALANSVTKSMPSAHVVDVLTVSATSYLKAEEPAFQATGLRLNWSTVQGTNRRLAAFFFGQQPLVLTPTAASTASAVPAPTLARVLLPGAASTASSVPAPQLARVLVPSAVAVPAAVPNPQLTLEILPQPASSPPVAPNPQLARELLPGPAVITATAPDVDAQQLLAPGPAASAAVVPAPQLTIEIRPDPAGVEAVAPASTLERVLTPDPAAITGSPHGPQLTLEILPSPTVEVSAVPPVSLDFSTLILPDPVPVAAAPAAAQLTLELVPDNAGAAAAVQGAQLTAELVPAPASSAASPAGPQLTLEILPSPAAAVAVVPAPLLTIEIRPDPAGCSAVVPDSALVRELAPGPAGAAASVPAAQLTLEFLPDPCGVPCLVPVIAQGYTIFPNPAGAAAAAPSPQLTIEIRPQPCGVVAVAPSCTVARRPAVLRLGIEVTTELEGRSSISRHVSGRPGDDEESTATELAGVVHLARELEATPSDELDSLSTRLPLRVRI